MDDYVFFPSLSSGILVAFHESPSHTSLCSSGFIYPQFSKPFWHYSEVLKICKGKQCVLDKRAKKNNNCVPIKDS